VIDWTGVAKLNEECGELVQVIGKLMSRPSGVGWQDERLIDKFNEELADVRAAVKFAFDTNTSVDRKFVRKRTNQKYAKFKIWNKKGQMNAGR